MLAQVETSDEAARLRARLLADHPRSLFIGVLCADHPDAIGEIVRPLAPVVRELIFTDTLGLPLATGEELAMRALNELGVGQDFVYTVPRLDEAIDYALGVLAASRRQGWEANAILVAGSPAAVERADRHLQRSRETPAPGR